MNMVSKLSIKMYVILALIIILSISYAMYTKGDSSIVHREGLTSRPKNQPSQSLSIPDIIKISKKILTSPDSDKNKLTKIMNMVVLPNEKRNLQSINAIKGQAKSQLFEDFYKVHSIDTTLQTMK